MSHDRLATPAIGIALVACVALAGCVFYLDPQCTDEIRNGRESDVDCGGICGPCTTGHRCSSGADCESAICGGGRCAPRPCENGVQDDAETDVDCGGGTCHRCAGGRRCQADADCFGGTCHPTQRTCTSLATVSFADPATYPAGFKAYVLFAGDLNRDGHVDLVAANEQDSSITVLLGRGDGTFQRLVPDVPTGEYPTGGALVDLDGDGILDVLTSNFHGNSVSVLLGVGDGTFHPAQHYPTVAGAETSNLAVGDLNGDGLLDVVATNPRVGSVSLFLGTGGGALAKAGDLPVGILGASSPYAVAIADFDGDGKNDLAVVEGTRRRIIVRRGNGNGTFGPEVAHPAVGNALLAADVDRDGKLDLVAAERDSNSVTVLLGRGDGTFRPPLTSTTGPNSGPYTIAIGDFNLDGVPDVVSANFTGSGTTLLLGIGDGRFEAPLTPGVTGDTSYGVVAADFDGDGKVDLAVCNATANDVKVLLNTSR